MNKQKNNTEVLTTHDIGVEIPMNTKYISGNPISRWLIQNFMRSLLDLAKDAQPTTVLDVGCGEGLALRQLQLLWSNASIYGLDIEEELLAVAKQIVPHSKVIAGNIYELPYDDKQFDMVVCTEVLEHLTEPAQALKELQRVCRHTCLLSVPNEPIWRIANMVRGSYWSAWGNTPGHLNHWSSQQFASFVSQSFQVVAVQRPFPWTMIRAQVR